MKKFTHGSKIFFAIIIIGILHFLGLIFYASFTQEQALTISRTTAIGESISIIKSLEKNPQHDYASELKQFYKTHLQLSVTTKPEWPLQIQDSNYWLLKDYLRKKTITVFLFTFNETLAEHLFSRQSPCLSLANNYADFGRLVTPRHHLRIMDDRPFQLPIEAI